MSKTRPSTALILASLFRSSHGLTYKFTLKVVSGAHNTLGVCNSNLHWNWHFQTLPIICTWQYLPNKVMVMAMCRDKLVLQKLLSVHTEGKYQHWWNNKLILPVWAKKVG